MAPVARREESNSSFGPPRQWHSHPRALKCRNGHGYYSVRETQMVFEPTGVMGLGFIECYRCTPATYQIVHFVRGDHNADVRAYCHAVKDKDTLEQARGMRDGGSSVGQVLEFVIQSWASEDE